MIRYLLQLKTWALLVLRMMLLYFTTKSYRWAAAWQNQQTDLCTQRRLRSAWASARSYQSSQCTQWIAKCLKLSSCGQRRLWSDWAHAQSDLSLRWAHKPFCWFWHDATQMINKVQDLNELRTRQYQNDVPNVLQTSSKTAWLAG